MTENIEQKKPTGWRLSETLIEEIKKEAKKEKINFEDYVQAVLSEHMKNIKSKNKNKN